jgi:SLOG cluster2
MPTIPFKPRLVLRVIWTAEFPDGSEFARHIYSRLCRDSERPASRGLGIPVYFHTGATPAAARLPDALDLDAAETTVVIVLIDTSIRADQPWRDCVRGIESHVALTDRRHLFLPIACEDKVHTVVDKTNCIRLYNVEPKDRPDRLISALTHELARLLLARGSDVKTEDFGTLEKSYAPVKLFISHSKHGREGTVIATELRDYGRQHLPVATFYDSNDIAAGSNFEKEIRANVADSAMLVVQTNTYSDREWCRKEVLFAKHYGCPVLVVNAVTIGEERSFPYLGNVPTIRWPFDSTRRCGITIDAALREVLRNVHFLEHVRTLKLAGLLPEACVQIGTAPEMLTYRNLLRANRCDRSKPSVLLYPDPPLGDEEIEVLEDLNPSNLTFATPTSIVALADPPKVGTPLKGQLIGISISNSADLADRGMSQAHLEDAMVECARHLLAQGASLGYGGDLRPGGFTTILFDLVRSHNRAGSKERIHNFLSWPIHLRLDPASWQEYLDEIHPYRVSPPPDLGVDEKVYVPPDTATGRYIWARSLTTMRQAMNQKAHARVLLGGQVTGFKGKYPGLFEEALFALRSGKPLYLVGGFGGCTRSIVDVLKGKTPEAFTEPFQSQEPLYKAIADRYRADAADKKTTPIDYAGELQFLQAKGLAGLNNGLSEDDNEILFTSRNLPEIVYLLLKGLTQRLS